ncbi:MAG: hypothetical protein ISS48_04810 [Candidatus Aenigmarchaeota archaeon]|nr:hypothetical protein [Candidatus Aenigmarchaeota archaeon]
MIIEGITKSERKVLKTIFSNPFKYYSLTHLQKECGVSYMSIFRSVRNLENLGLIKKVLISGNKFRTLNFKDERLLKLLEMSEVGKRLELKKKNAKTWPILAELTEKLIDSFRHNLLMVILVNSTAKKGLMSRSNANVLVVVPDSKDNAEATISEALPYFKRKNVVATVILLEEFMVGVKEIDLFKKILENMTILYGEHIFWREISKLDQGNKLFL